MGFVTISVNYRCVKMFPADSDNGKMKQLLVFFRGLIFSSCLVYSIFSFVSTPHHHHLAHSSSLFPLSTTTHLIPLKQPLPKQSTNSLFPSSSSSSSYFKSLKPLFLHVYDDSGLKKYFIKSDPSYYHSEAYKQKISNFINQQLPAVNTEEEILYLFRNATFAGYNVEKNEEEKIEMDKIIEKYLSLSSSELRETTTRAAYIAAFFTSLSKLQYQWNLFGFKRKKTLILLLEEISKYDYQIPWQYVELILSFANIQIPWDDMTDNTKLNFLNKLIPLKEMVDDIGARIIVVSYGNLQVNIKEFGGNIYESYLELYRKAYQGLTTTKMEDLERARIVSLPYFEKSPLLSPLSSFPFLLLVIGYGCCIG